MRILITNDDGINAPGLEVLEQIAVEIAGSRDDVWTVAPAFEQSGVGHCISYARPLMVARLGPHRYAADGSPADCVLAAIFDVFEGARPDLVLSGVNHGNNTAENVLYSGTLGGAMEAALQGIPAIALSQFTNRRTDQLDDPFDSARHHGVSVVRHLLDKAIWTEDDYRVFYNVNFPATSAAETKGLKVASQGFRRGSGFAAEGQTSPNGRRFLWLKSGPQNAPAGAGTDAEVNLQNHIAVTPLRADLTAHDLMQDLAARLA